MLNPANYLGLRCHPARRVMLAIGLAVLSVRVLSSAFAGDWKPSRQTPPDVPREFRAAWIASVYNLDWPSKPGLSESRQKAELIKILDGAVAGGLNAVILQVRPAADALYDSPYESWSTYLTGKSGRSPGYDPLVFACTEAHRRGLELHAWFNPFRGQSSYKNAVPGNHLIKRRPEWVKRYGNYLWLDPGIPAVREHTLKVITDVVSRYDIDGVHIDDYFYPYPYPSNDNARPFPDDDSWRQYGGKGKRDDWRRRNINHFIQQLHGAIRSTKPWVKFGISPFGIWRPGVPSDTTAGLDAYGQLYADSRKWLNSGWLDYLSPQLYWDIASDGQSFPLLLKWWHGQNRKRRHVWPGLATDRVGAKRRASEIVEQIRITRRFGSSSPGHIHWSSKNFLRDQGGVKRLVNQTLYRDRALVPQSPWMGDELMALPDVRIEATEGRLAVTLDATATPRFWVVQSLVGSRWRTRVLAGRNTRFEIDSADVVAVSALGRFGELSRPTVLSR